MNAIDYFFENTSRLEKLFLVGKEEITYKNLYKETLKLASWLRKEIGTGKNIIILSVNNLFMLKTYLAVIKSENVCIPLDPRIEQDNFDYIAKLTEPSMILLTEDILKRLPLGDYRCVLPSDIENIEDDKESDINYETDSEECAEIIFTSGSTGEPKGVMISHKNLIANTSSIVEYLKLTADDRMLVVLPFYYCYGLSLLHTHLRVGGSIVFNNSFIFLGRVIQDLIDHECTGFAGIPSHFQILLRKSDTFKETSFPHLKYVTQAGGKLADLAVFDRQLVEVVVVLVERLLPREEHSLAVVGDVRVADHALRVVDQALDLAVDAVHFQHAQRGAGREVAFPLGVGLALGVGVVRAAHVVVLRKDNPAELLLMGGEAQCPSGPAGVEVQLGPARIGRRDLRVDEPPEPATKLPAVCRGVFRLPPTG